MASRPKNSSHCFHLTISTVHILVWLNAALFSWHYPLKPFDIGYFLSDISARVNSFIFPRHRWLATKRNPLFFATKFDFSRCRSNFLPHFGIFIFLFLMTMGIKPAPLKAKDQRSRQSGLSQITWIDTTVIRINMFGVCSFNLNILK